MPTAVIQVVCSGKSVELIAQYASELEKAIDSLDTAGLTVSYTETRGFGFTRDPNTLSIFDLPIPKDLREKLRINRCFTVSSLAGLKASELRRVNFSDQEIALLSLLMAGIGFKFFDE